MIELVCVVGSSMLILGLMEIIREIGELREQLLSLKHEFKSTIIEQKLNIDKPVFLAHRSGDIVAKLELKDPLLKAGSDISIGSLVASDPFGMVEQAIEHQERKVREDMLGINIIPSRNCPDDTAFMFDKHYGFGRDIFMHPNTVAKMTQVMDEDKSCIDKMMARSFVGNLQERD